jgi:hypothetical protein
MTKEELKAIIRDAPRIEATFAEVDSEFQTVAKSYAALKVRRDELSGHLAQIASARAELGEPSPAPKTAAKPKGKGN